MAWNSCAKRGVVGLGVLEWKTQIITKGMLGFFAPSLITEFILRRKRNGRAKTESRKSKKSSWETS